LPNRSADIENSQATPAAALFNFMRQGILAAHLQAEFSIHHVHNLRVRLRRRPPRIHHYHPLRLAPRNRHIAVSYSPEKRPALLLETILVFVLSSGLRCFRDVAPPRPLHARCHIRIEQDRQIGLQVVAQNAMQLQHGLCSQLPSAPLVGLRVICEPVAQHHLPLGHGVFDDLPNMLRPRRKHQRHLCHRRKFSCCRVQNDMAYLLACRRSARLASDHHRLPKRPQRLRELLYLRALAGSVQTFKCDELTAMGLGHVGIIKHSVPDCQARYSLEPRAQSPEPRLQSPEPRAQSPEPGPWTLEPGASPITLQTRLRETFACAPAPSDIFKNLLVPDLGL